VRDCLDHIQLGIFEAHEQVKGGAWWTKRERPRAVLRYCVAPGPAGRAPRYHAVYADRRPWAGQRAVTIKLDQFHNGLRLRYARNDIKSGSVEDIQTLQRRIAASLSLIFIINLPAQYRKR
jgi:hypothetical protein